MGFGQGRPGRILAVPSCPGRGHALVAFLLCRFLRRLFLDQDKSAGLRPMDMFSGSWLSQRIGNVATLLCLTLVCFKAQQYMRRLTAIRDNYQAALGCFLRARDILIQFPAGYSLIVIRQVFLVRVKTII